VHTFSTGGHGGTHWNVNKEMPSFTTVSYPSAFHILAESGMKSICGPHTVRGASLISFSALPSCAGRKGTGARLVWTLFTDAGRGFAGEEIAGADDEAGSKARVKDEMAAGFVTTAALCVPWS
jgi:hypothetical protein